MYSKATNHFHCIRAGCGFTFTSTSQMTSHKRKHERRHVRSSGVLGLPPSLLGAKDTEPEESSNDDLVDFSALSSKNSSLSASPTSQQSSASLATAAATTEAAPSATKPPSSKIPGLMPQGLQGSIPLALALSNSGLPTTAPYFPLLPGRGSTSLPVGAPGLLGAMSSGAAASATPDTPVLVASGAGDSALATATSVPVPPASIMERISASKGLISPMMARLAAAALKPSATFDPGEQARPCPGSKHLLGPSGPDPALWLQSRAGWYGGAVCLVPALWPCTRQCPLSAWSLSPSCVFPPQSPTPWPLAQGVLASASREAGTVGSLLGPVHSAGSLCSHLPHHRGVPEKSCPGTPSSLESPPADLEGDRSSPVAG